MCGIVGIYYFEQDREVELAHVRAMADRIAHRGPDDSGFHVEGNVGLGMRRLSIIDITGGYQPIYTPDGRYVIVFNGEMFNFQEEREALRRCGHQLATQTDTEVVLHLYAEHGLAFTDYLNGMYALCIYDRLQRDLIIVRDRVGVKPLYYYQDERVLLFASEIKALFAFPGVRPALDMEGLGAYLSYGFTPAPYTLLRGVRKLAPATYLRVRDSRVEQREYWRPSYAQKLADSEEALKERLYALLADAVRRQMIADVPLGAFLSGGFDSSGIVHLMSEISPGPVSTYSIGFGEGFEAYNELEAASRFARDHATRQHELVVKPDVAGLLPQLVYALDEPVADSSFLLTHLIAKLARQSVKVILSGVGGDEVFGGYRRYLDASVGNYVAAVPRVVRQFGVTPLLRMLPADRNGRVSNVVRLARSYMATADLPSSERYGRYTQVFTADVVSELAVRSEGVPDYYRQLCDACDSPELLDKLMYFDLKTSLPEQLLLLTDKMTMAVSLEARVPLLDHRVVEFAARLPSKLKVNGLKLRYLQKETFRGRLPDYVYVQRKKGFGAPVGAWLREELAPLCTELLGEAYLRAQGLFSPAIVAELVRRHRARVEDHTDQLWALTVFQLWCRSYALP
jgi:asparagine synthase (glutamine-hydrolysing)